MLMNNQEPKHRPRKITYLPTFKLGQLVKVKGTNITGEIIQIKWTKTRLNVSIYQCKVEYWSEEMKKWRTGKS